MKRGLSDLSISRTDPRLGRAGAGRPEARHVCLGRRADQLYHRDRLSRRRPASEILAGRRACDRQGHHPLPRRLLAGLPHVGRAARAAPGRRARISVQPRREDVEVGRQRGEPGRSGRGLRPRSGALLLPAGSAVRAGRQLLARGDRRPDDRRSRQRHRQLGPAFAHHDRQELRRRRARPAGVAPTPEDLAILGRADALLGDARRHMQRSSSSTTMSPPCSRSSPRQIAISPIREPWKLAKSRPGADASRSLRNDRSAAHLRDPSAARHARRHDQAARPARARAGSAHVSARSRSGEVRRPSAN